MGEGVPPIEELVAGNLRRYRKMRGLTQAELVALLGPHGLGFVDWPQQRIALIEAGRRRVGLGELVVLAAALDVGLSSLLEGVDAVLEALAGRRGDLIAEHTGGHGWDDRPPPIRPAGVGEAERWAARRLRVPVAVVVDGARRRWGQTLTDKRESLIHPEAYAGAGKAQLAAVRRQVTLELLPELAGELGLELEAEEA